MLFFGKAEVQFEYVLDTLPSHPDINSANVWVCVLEKFVSSPSNMC